MSKHLQVDLHRIHREILRLAALVEEMIDNASRALRERRYDLAEMVINGDSEIDRREIEIEEDCLEALALHQPVAVDLRRIATVIKVNSDLERIADLAVNMAERAQALASHSDFHFPAKLERMVELATQMVRGALDAFVKLDVAAARRICALDDEVDRYNNEIIAELHERMLSDSRAITPGFHCFSATRHLERIGDHATNIAEDVIYLVEGIIARHKHVEA